MNVGDINGKISSSDWPSAKTESTQQVGAAEKREILSAIPDARLPGLGESGQINLDYDTELQSTIVRVVDRRSGDTILQIPGKEVLARARYYRELEKL